MFQLINIPKMAYILFRPRLGNNCTTHCPTVDTNVRWIANDRARSSLSPAAWGHMPGNIGPCLANNMECHWLASYLQRLLTLASRQINPTSVMSCQEICYLSWCSTINFGHSGCVIKPMSCFAVDAYIGSMLTEWGFWNTLHRQQLWVVALSTQNMNAIELVCC